MLLKEDVSYASPVSVVYFENYNDINNLKQRLDSDKEKIQCIVSAGGFIENSEEFGNTQKPKLWDYADDIDTMKFLIGLKQ